jgi:O-antigen ligase
MSLEFAVRLNNGAARSSAAFKRTRTNNVVVTALLFSLAAATTLGIASRSPFLAWGYEGGVFGLGLWLSLTAWGEKLNRRDMVWAAPLLAIAVWGFVQLVLNATEYRWATLMASLQFASWSATALIARTALASERVRTPFLRALAWFGFLVSVVAVLAYHTSGGKVLWVFHSPYPDVWGPFLSRNNFAQFLELCVPAALYLGQRTEKGSIYCIFAAVMLAAGLASASRAGGMLLIAEVAGVYLFVTKPGRRRLRWLLPTAAVCVAVAGAGTLWNRLGEPDPLRYRREIFHASVEMIRSRPLAGYGLGTFPVVYPEFAEFDSGAAVEHAHNDWLEWTAEGGIVFAALWAALFAHLARPAIRSIWGVGVVAVFLHALVDYPFARHGVAAWVFVLAGALCRSAPSSKLRNATGAGTKSKGDLRET